MINKITATKQNIIFKCDGNTLSVKVYSPAVKEILLLGEYSLNVANGEAVLDRYATGRDGAFLKYVAEDGCPKYVSHVESEFQEDYPNPGTKKGLQIEVPEDAIALGAKFAAINVAITDLFLPEGSPDTEDFVFDGVTYHVNAKMQARNDDFFKKLTDAGVIITLIMLCAKHWRRQVADELRGVLLHPDYNSEGTLSAFNVQTDEGIRYVQAFCTYYAKRYGPGSEHGRIYGGIMSNEVQSQWIWGNAGEKTCSEFANEYTTVLRTSQLCGEAISSCYRAYISLDHFWGKSMFPDQPLRYYPAKELLDEIMKKCEREGDFAWNIAHHPYPQDLTKPDFWNDDTATFTPDTHRITFKNLEILADWLREPNHTFEGARRHIILSEQGFNSKYTPESELLQAFAFGRAYRKIMEIPEIDALIHYAHRDHYVEFGLCLGMWRRYEDDSRQGEYNGTKPIYDLYKVIDTIDDTGKYVWERF